MELTGPCTSPLSIPDKAQDPSPSPHIPRKPARPSQNSRSMPHASQSPSPAPNKTQGSTSSTRKVSRASNVQGMGNKVGASGKQIIVCGTISPYRFISHRLSNATTETPAKRQLDTYNPDDNNDALFDDPPVTEPTPQMKPQHKRQRKVQSAPTRKSKQSVSRAVTDTED